MSFLQLQCLPPVPRCPQLVAHEGLYVGKVGVRLRDIEVVWAAELLLHLECLGVVLQGGVEVAHASPDLGDACQNPGPLLCIRALKYVQVRFVGLDVLPLSRFHMTDQFIVLRLLDQQIDNLEHISSLFCVISPGSGRRGWGGPETKQEPGAGPSDPQ